MSDTIYLNLCRKKIEDKLEWIDSKSLKHRDFQFLSDLIFEKTKTQISVSTLKRLWNKSYTKSFQITTLDALAQYLEYKNWHSFKAEEHEDIANQNIRKIKRNTSRRRTSKTTFKAIFSILILTTLVILTYTYINHKVNKEIENEFLFDVKTSVEEDVPNTVIFNYDVSTVSSDSIYIQFSWNDRDKVMIDKNDRFYTNTYFYPGYHYARLMIDNTFVKGQFVHIKTSDWLALARREIKDTSPVYIMHPELKSNGIIYASPKIFEESNIGSYLNDFLLSYYNVRDFEGLSGNDFSMETAIKIEASVYPILCTMCRINITTDNGIYSIPISSKGCVSDIFMRIGDQRISGKTNDLSSFGFNMEVWKNLKVVAKNKTLRIFVDNTLIYEAGFDHEFGNIKGFHYLFKGHGAIDFLNVYNAEGKIIYQDNFD